MSQATANKGGLPPAGRFAVSLAILGVVMFSLPQAAVPLGVILVIGSLIAANVKDPAAPIKAFDRLVYGG